MISQLTIPAEIPGHLFVSSMPGRYSPFPSFLEYLETNDIARIVCLTPSEEVQLKSPEYWDAWRADTIPSIMTHFPIEDYGAPDDREGFFDLVSATVDDLRAGRHLIAHCGGGIGRAGTFAASVLLLLGETRQSAIQLVHRVGSSPQTDAQQELVTWVGQRHGEIPQAP